MDIFGNQESDFCRLDVPQLHVCKKNEVKERSSIQEELEPSINKEEEEELRSNPEEEEQDIKPDKIFIIQVEEKHICKEETDDEQLLWKQERSSNLDEEEPELQHIKAEQQEYFISEGGELLEQKQETDAFTVTEHDQERMDYKPSESPDLEENTPIRNSHHFEHLGNSSTLENHCQIDIEEVLDVLKCSVCGKTFTQSYLNHSQVKQLDVIHSGVTLGLCEPCRNRLDQGDAVTIQLDTPSDKRSHFCKVCGKVFMGRDVPQLHVPEDEEERSFLDQDQPEPPQIKEEEEEELSSSQEEEHLLLKQEIKSERDELYVIQFEGEFHPLLNINKKKKEKIENYHRR
ncbi:zinc finger and BTB domain-containing protein 26 isoform X4 [Oryzias melastigma]|uniref:zinc finger and BTB domain-containing protein 26 isoform X4 n=1 Tax=Oryzias melastigma TaxID=30732 RepID=UPI00168D4AA2|nr:zinc finger and BTB domain-containing protein 26 isoform X4 [Oryzias melastigma]